MVDHTCLVASVALAAANAALEEGEGSDHPTNLVTKPPPVSKEDLKPTNPLLSPGLKTLVEDRGGVSIDPEGKKLQIDDLIIIPNRSGH